MHRGQVYVGGEAPTDGVADPFDAFNGKEKVVAYPARWRLARISQVLLLGSILFLAFVITMTMREEKCPYSEDEQVGEGGNPVADNSYVPSATEIFPGGINPPVESESMEQATIVSSRTPFLCRSWLPMDPRRQSRPGASPDVSSGIPLLKVSRRMDSSGHECQMTVDDDFPVLSQAPLAIHIAHHKTGSQWMARIFRSYTKDFQLRPEARPLLPHDGCQNEQFAVVNYPFPCRLN
eukprot:jgi/Mesvir1/4695/Mv19973-RA.1